MQTALRRKTETGNEKDPSAALGMTKRGNVSPFFHSAREANLRPFGAPPSKGRRENAAGIGLPFLAHRLRGVPLRGKEKECRSSHRHFERKREIFSVPFSHDPFAKPLRGSTASAFPRYGVSRFLLSNTLRLTANEKDPSAALGMTKRGNVSPFFHSAREANLRPFGAPPSKGRRENAAGIGLPFLAHRLRGVPLRGKEEECRLFASSFRAKARNLFRSRSGKSCEGSG